MNLYLFIYLFFTFVVPMAALLPSISGDNLMDPANWSIGGGVRTIETADGKEYIYL